MLRSVKTISEQHFRQKGGGSFVNCKKLIFLTLIGLMFLSLTSILNGQSLDELIDLAEQNNPSLRVMSAYYQAAKYTGDQVAVYPDPIVGMGFGAYPVETRLGPQRMRLNVSQRLLWKGELSARRSLEDAKAEVLAYQTENRMIDLAYIIKRSYYELVFLDNIISLTREKLGVLDILKEIATNAIEGGKGRLSNVLLIQRRKEDLLSRIKELEVEKGYFTIQINHAIGRDPDTAITPDTSTQNNWEAPVFVSQDFVETDHPRLKTLENARSVSQKAIDLTKYAAKPKVMVGLDYIMVDQRPVTDLQGNGRDVIMPMGTVTIPIHTGQYEAKRQEERIKMDAIDASIENTKNDFYAEISQARTKIEESDILIDKSNNLKRITESTIDLMRTEYINDGNRFEELLRLEMDHIQYDVEIEIARKQKRVALASLEKFKI